jgi:general nucleoside transport system permease protein
MRWGVLWWTMPDHNAVLPPLSLQGAPDFIGGRLSLPRFVLEVRLDMPAWKQALVLACSVTAGLLISAAILIVAGVPAPDLFNEFAASIIDRQSLHAVLVEAGPLILVGIAASIGFRARFWNLGLEGQMVWGGIAATAVSIYQIGPEILRLPVMAVFAMLAGIGWVAIPAFLRMKFAVNEIISTLLLNYVATYFLYD